MKGFTLVVEGGGYLGKTHGFELNLLLGKMGLPGRAVVGKGVRKRMLGILGVGGGTGGNLESLQLRMQRSEVGTQCRVWPECGGLDTR